ncbi:uncharacterized protein LOC101894624 isoform X2 [Musca domestica]|uniref:Uncharacterized protein LOC101894624 isoform X2 n=1 Tax=Musca domestica TaxID=7370 RepID=A0A1I8M3E2_MUSDO|nr:uncharacterized protein LOC101894624 isoform X2 [Musca domestica]
MLVIKKVTLIIAICLLSCCSFQSSHLSDTDSGSDFGGYNYSPPNDIQYLPPSTPAPVYGPPAPIYGPPAPVYGPPQTNFYKPLQFPHHPRDQFTLLEKLKTKVNLFTIGKIILKLLIFKKIIKFIGVICLLLFLPKLKGLIKDDMAMDEDSTESKQVETDNNALEKRIDDIYEFALNAINNFPDNIKFDI